MRARLTLTLFLAVVAACEPIPDHGVELVYDLPEVAQPDIHETTCARVAERLALVGGRGAAATRRGHQLLIRLPGGEALGLVKRTLARRGQLWFRAVDDGATAFLTAFEPDPLSSALALARAAEQLDPDLQLQGLPDPGDLLAEPVRPARPLPAGVEVQREQVSAGEQGRITAYYLQAPSEAELRRGLATISTSGELPTGRELVISRETGRGPPSGPGERYRTFLVERSGWNAGAHITEVEVTTESGFPGQLSLLIRFDREGAKTFGDLTESLVQRRLAIVLDGEVASAPVVMERIGEGNARIALGADARQSDYAALAAALQTGALPEPLRLVAEKRYGAERPSPSP